MTDFITEFLAGQSACSKGKPCQADASEAFKRGYESEKENGK